MTSSDNGASADADRAFAANAVEPVSRLDPDGLQSLALLCEAADGPDREIDGRIAAALRLGRKLPDWAARWEGEWRATIQGSVVLMLDNGTAGVHFEAAQFTASTEAALAIAPDGAGMRLERYWNRHGEAWSCEIALGGLPDNPRRVFDCYDANSPALALCAAALRAIAMEARQGGDAKQAPSRSDDSAAIAQQEATHDQP